MLDVPKKVKRNDNNLAIAYYRYSSHAQNEASIDQQRELAHAYAEAHGYEIVREYSDAAISGTTDDRPGFQAMLAEIGRIRPSALIVWRNDRLGRDAYVLAFARKTIDEAGCRIEYVDGVNVDPNLPEAALFDGIADAFASYYSRQLSANIRRGMRYNLEHCLYNGIKRFGYSHDETKHYVEDPETAPVVRRIFAEYADGVPMKEIAAWLNAEGWRTTSDKEWRVQSIQKILVSRSYLGEYHRGDEWVPGGMPALVDEATFERVQKRLTENKRNSSRSGRGPAQPEGADAPRYWLTGKLYCGECGEPMSGMYGRGKMGKAYFYYRCTHKGCKKKAIRKERIEAVVMDVLSAVLDDTQNTASLAVDVAKHWRETHAETGYAEGLKAALAECERKLGNLVKAIENGIFSESTQARLTELEAQKAGYKDAIELEEARAKALSDEGSIQVQFERFAHANLDDPDVRDAVLEYFVDRIYLHDDKYTVTFKFEDMADASLTFDEYEEAAEQPPDGEFDCLPASSTTENRTGRARCDATGRETPRGRFCVSGPSPRPFCALPRPKGLHRSG